MKEKLKKQVLAWLIIFCIGGTALPIQHISAGEAEVHSVPIKVACVGDSLTFGYLSSNQRTKSYPARLQELLGDGYIVENFGRNSATLLTGTDRAYEDQQPYRDSLVSDPDIVIIMLGTNDSKAKYWDQGGRERFKADAKKLVSTYQNLSSGPEVIFATSPACLYASVGDIRGNIIEDEIVPMQRELAEENNWKMIDMFDLTSDKDTLYHNDGIHFSDAGYYYEAECMYSAVTGEAFLPEPLPAADISGLTAHPGNEPQNAVDDDYTTFWHSEWDPASSREDHVLVLELKERSLAEEFYYLPRQTGANGIITQYEIQISNDGGSQYTKAAEGTWAADTSWKKVQFSDPAAATHIKLIVKNATGSGGSHASAAEIRAVGKAYTAGSLLEARTDLQADYRSCQQRYHDETLYEEESWKVFSENMQLVQNRMNQDDLTLEEASRIGKQLRESALALQKKEAEPLDAAKVMDRKFFKAEDGTILPYRIYLPEGYTAEKKYPLVLFLHGAGERGSTNTAQLTNSNKDFFDRMLGSERKNYPAIIVAPQCLANEQWVDAPWANGCYQMDAVAKSNEMQAVEELLAELQAEYSVNQNRLYAVGFSMGAFGVWDLIMRNPELISAAIPISGAGDPLQAEKIKNVPIWCFHGADDPTVPCETSTPVMADALKEAGSENIRYTEYPAGTFDNGHLIASGVYAEEEFLSWMFGQKKKMEDKDLSDAILSAEKKDPGQYTKESYEEFLKALQEAKALLADDSAQQEDLDEALARLKEAEEGLKEKPKEVVEKPVSLTAPSLRSVSRQAKSITVSWSPVPNASGYEVSYGMEGAYKIVMAAGQSTASYRLEGANDKAVYQFRIRAYRDADGKRYYSAYSPWNTQSVDIPKPKSVSAKKSGKTIRIKWKKISGATGYKILRRTGKKGKFKTVGTVKKGKKVTFTDKKVKAGTKYYYKVQALSKSGSNTCMGPFSAVKSVNY